LTDPDKVQIKNLIISFFSGISTLIQVKTPLGIREMISNFGKEPFLGGHREKGT
jgi:hypothetical protein